VQHDPVGGLIRLCNDRLVCSGIGQAGRNAHVAMRRFFATGCHGDFGGQAHGQDLSGALEERAFILEIPRLICFTDVEFADGYERFDRVHVYATDQDVIDALNAAIGREVLVEGRAMGAHTGHHRAPMVLRVNSVKAR